MNCDAEDGSLPKVLNMNVWTDLHSSLLVHTTVVWHNWECLKGHVLTPIIKLYDQERYNDTHTHTLHIFTWALSRSTSKSAWERNWLYSTPMSEQGIDVRDVMRRKHTERDSRGSSQRASSLKVDFPITSKFHLFFHYPSFLLYEPYRNCPHPEVATHAQQHKAD